MRAAEAAHPGERLRLPPPGNPVLYVVGDGVKLRAGPRGNARVLGQLGDGDRLQDLSRRGAWVRVRVAASGLARGGSPSGT